MHLIDEMLFFTYLVQFVMFHNMRAIITLFHTHKVYETTLLRGNFGHGFEMRGLQSLIKAVFVG